MLAFYRWKQYPVTPASSGPKPQAQVPSYQPKSRPPSIQTASQYYDQPGSFQSGVYLPVLILDLLDSMSILWTV